MITDSGLTVDEFLAQVRSGQILPEMSEEAAKVVSGFAVKAGPGSAIIRDTIVGRKISSSTAFTKGYKLI